MAFHKTRKQLAVNDRRAPNFIRCDRQPRAQVALSSDQKSQRIPICMRSIPHHDLTAGEQEQDRRPLDQTRSLKSVSSC
jgi:hypothetical protein